jgi:acetyltransferase-like isoleucine patch superfamily enzyme
MSEINLIKTYSAQGLSELGKLKIEGSAHIDDTARFCYPKITELDNIENIKPVTLGDGCFIQSGAVIYGGCTLGPNVRIGHNSVVLWNVEIGEGSFITYHVGIEANCRIGKDCCIYMHSHLTSGSILEDYVFVAPNVQTSNDWGMRYHRQGHGENLQGIYAETGVRIAVGSIILPGVRLHRNALIGGGALVTKDVPENTVVYGVPAKKIDIVPKEDRL